jgi:hypothetical protein
VRSGALYLLAHGLASLAGLPVIWMDEVHQWSWTGRAAAAFAVGAIVVAVESTALTLLGIAWNPWIVLGPPILLAAWLHRRALGGPRPERRAFRPGALAAAIGILVAAVAVGYMAWSLATSRATSTDFLLFWGVKAVYLAKLEGVDASWMARPFFTHTQPFYPPLVTTLDAWGILAAGHMPWRTAPLMALAWLAAASVLVLEIARRRLGDRDATLVAAFWTAALSASLVASWSGANGEAPLLLYETAAGLLLLTEGEHPGASRRWLAGIFLAGAVLTKIEGTIGSSLMIVGVVLRDLLSRRPPRRRELAALVIPPLCAGLLWWAYLRRFGIPASYSGRGRLAELHWDRLAELVGNMLLNLRAGAWWVAWILPAVVLLAAGRRCWRPLLPALVAAVGLMLFFLFVYLHETSSQAERIGWEIPRTSQSPLSLLILSAAVCWPPSPASRQTPDS